jgi:hypothetical protein
LGDKAPFEGILYDPEAVAISLADKEQNEKEFNLRLKYFNDRCELDCKFKVDNLDLRINTLTEINEKILNEKEKQIKALRDEASGNLSFLWGLLGGSGIGALMMLIILAL